MHIAVTTYYLLMRGPQREPCAGKFYNVNIFLHPFNFSAPEFFIREGQSGRDEGFGKFVGFWRLPALGMGDGLGFNISDADWERARTEIVDTPIAPSANTAQLGL